MTINHFRGLLVLAMKGCVSDGQLPWFKYHWNRDDESHQGDVPELRVEDLHLREEQQPDPLLRLQQEVRLTTSPGCSLSKAIGRTAREMLGSIPATPPIFKSEDSRWERECTDRKTSLSFGRCRATFTHHLGSSPLVGRACGAHRRPLGQHNFSPPWRTVTAVTAAG